MEEKDRIRNLLEQFQAGYTARDLEKVDAFMQFFTEKAEVIGTNGLKPGVEEWYMDRDSARKLVHGDWKGWGDVRLLWETLSIRVYGNAGWFAVSATVTENITDKTYGGYLGYLNEFIEKAPMTDEQKLLYILRGGSNLLYEIHRGSNFEWPLRLTGCVVLQEGEWKFDQMCFSFPTIYLPDIRNMPGEDVQWY